MLTIPKSQRASVQRLIELPPEALKALAKSLDEATPTESFRALAEQLNARMKEPIEGLFGILHVLYALGTIREENGLTVKALVADLVSAAQEDPEGMLPPGDDWDRVQQSLMPVFKSAGPAVITGKAGE